MNTLFLLAVVIFIYMSFWFWVSIIKKRNDVADTAWGLGFILLSWTAFFVSGQKSPAAFLINSLITIWGLRLAFHIHQRNKNKPEDYRYQTWRQEWVKWFYLRSFLQVFLLQGLLLFCIATPAIIINLSTNPKTNWPTLAVGLVLWCIGFYFESRGDKELADFVKNSNNKGEILQTGLWKYSRHPNYFGEITIWWAIWIISLSVTAWWPSIIGPLAITLLITKVSGIPLLENKMLGNPKFQEYAKHTSVLIPWFKK